MFGLLARQALKRSTIAKVATQKFENIDSNAFDGYRIEETHFLCEQM